MKSVKKRILIADGCKDTLQEIKSYKGSKKYQIEFVATGKECLEKIRHFEPQLVIIDFMLPGMHGIEVLNIIKAAPSMSKVGVIISSYNSMKQNYHSAIKMGANYYLEKPFEMRRLFTLIERFFLGKLSPDPFPEHLHSSKEVEVPAIADKKTYTSYIKFWGSRGSNPVAGPEYVRFGGNTCCLEVHHGKDMLIIDAGSGIRSLGNLLSTETQKKYDLLFSHTHWDHLLGFPFFRPIYQADCEIRIWAPIGFEKTTKELFSDMLASAYFPVGLEDIQSKIVFKDLRDAQKVSFGSIEIYTHYAFHPGSTLCFRIHMGGKKIGYVTDNEFLMGYHGHPKLSKKKKDQLLKPYESMIKFFQGCDLMIHEAQYSSQEYTSRLRWGHSSISNASVFIKSIGCKDWIVTHHDPRHTDADLLKKSQRQQDIMQELNHNCRIRLAYDGMFIPI